MGWASIVTLSLAVAVLSEFVVWEKRDHGLDWSEIEEPVNSTNGGLGVIVGAWVAWLITLYGGAGTFYGLVVAAFFVFLRSCGEPDVYVTKTGILAYRPIWGPGRESRLAWAEIDSAISLTQRAEGQISHKVTVGSVSRSISFTLDDPAGFLEMMEQRGIPTARY